MRRLVDESIAARIISPFLERYDRLNHIVEVPLGMDGPRLRQASMKNGMPCSWSGWLV